MCLAKDDMCVLHPLPRVNEISVKVDEDKRACYFKQTLYGKYMRMALILKLLEDAKRNPENTTKKCAEEGFSIDGFNCKNPHCILTTEQELEPLCYKDDNGKVRCIYCDSVIC